MKLCDTTLKLMFVMPMPKYLEFFGKILLGEKFVDIVSEFSLTQKVESLIIKFACQKWQLKITSPKMAM